VQEVEVTRRFAAPPQAVWDVYTDHAGWKEWAGFRSSWLEVRGDPDPNGTGAVRGFGSGGIRVFEEVLEFDPPRRMTYRVVRGGLPMKNHLGEVVFEPDGEGTRVVWRCRFESRIPGLGGPMRRFVARVFRNGLEGLARLRFPDPAR
jgi:uncharacterized protein YndB with AHSA1/START domain